ncbi:MAG: cell wall-active antibiotics response protein [Bacteroidetes bacterium]|nr:cell wall-active antibiotics response protein [Bacteroidota bacterium]
MNNSRSILGAFLIFFGGLFLLDNFEIFYFDFTYHFLNWYTFFVIVGVLIVSKSKDSGLGWILVAFGALGIAGRIFDFSLRFIISDFWPLLLIGLGLYVILNRKSGTASGSSNSSSASGIEGSQSNADTIDEVSIFYGSKRIITSDNFQGGKVTSIFGGTDLDLTNAKLAQGHQVIDILSIFGGMQLYTRQDLKIDVKVTSIFGGFADKRIKMQNVVPDQSRTLVLKGLVIFGGGSIKNYA